MGDAYVMALLISRSEGWLSTLRKTVFSACALFAFPMFSSISPANEVEVLSMENVDGVYSLRIVSVLDAPLEYVHNVITDYIHAYRISPTLTEVEILPSGRDGVSRVRNHSEHWVGQFLFQIDWVGDFVEPKYGHLKVNTISELSSFESGFAVWELRPQGGRTWVRYESSLKPDFFIPPFIGDHIMKKQMKEETLDTFSRIECYAKAMFEVGMANELVLMDIILAEARDCINSQGNKAHLSFDITPYINPAIGYLTPPVRPWITPRYV